jgi:hypothetical protein
MTQFNDRRPGTGPKDLTSLAQAAQSYRKLREAQDAKAAGNPRAQGAIDDAFEELSLMHVDENTGQVDSASLQNTLKYFDSHYKKGKSV